MKILKPWRNDDVMPLVSGHVHRLEIRLPSQVRVEYFLSVASITEAISKSIR